MAVLKEFSSSSRLGLCCIDKSKRKEKLVGIVLRNHNGKGIHEVRNPKSGEWSIEEYGNDDDDVTDM